MISPSIGRQVWYWPSAQERYGRELMAQAEAQPLAATVIAVWGDRNVNLLVIDSLGRTFPKQQVLLLQDDDAPPTDPVWGYAQWMPYQVAAAAVPSAPA